MTFLLFSEYALNLNELICTIVLLLFSDLLLCLFQWLYLLYAITGFLSGS